MSIDGKDFDHSNGFTAARRPRRAEMWLAILAVFSVCLIVVLLAGPAIEKSKEARRRAALARKSSYRGMGIALAGYQDAHHRVFILNQQFEYQPQHITFDEEQKLQAEIAVDAPVRK